MISRHICGELEAMRDVSRNPVAEPEKRRSLRSGESTSSVLRVNALANLLRAEPAVELLVVDSRESFQRNKEFYQARLEEESLPALRELLVQDIRHLDEILSSSASAREFVLILRRDLKSDMNEGTLRQLEKGICDHGLHVRLADEQDVKRLLAVYYQHDVTTDFFEDVDGGKAVIQNGK